ncbi:MAG TPA: hypothetical protein VD999_03120 [Vitreimonas sp.]|nr:hypothetical protein [Vitreimonas sp.]
MSYLTEALTQLEGSSAKVAETGVITPSEVQTLADHQHVLAAQLMKLQLILDVWFAEEQQRVVEGAEEPHVAEYDEKQFGDHEVWLELWKKYLKKDEETEPLSPNQQPSKPEFQPATMAQINYVIKAIEIYFFYLKGDASWEIVEMIFNARPTTELVVRDYD